MSKYVIGLDYGSDSCRAYIVDAATGVEQGTAVKYYPRWMKGLYCQPTANQYRQHPNDYIECLEGAVKEALAKCDPSVAANVIGMSFDTTGSTPVFTD
ncbi:MAG TPA: ribulokinase, partial [Bacteroidales bacterium]|nr:ribulokinase [Bacteroidales bacterium]